MESKYFDIIELFIQYNTDSCCEYVTGDVNIYLYGCTSVLVSKHVCLCVCVCVWSIKNHITSKNPHYVSDVIKVHDLLKKGGKSS